MNEKSLAATLDKVEACLNVSSNSSLKLLAGNQVQLRRYISTLGDIVLPQIDYPLLAVQLGGGKVENTHAISLPSVSTLKGPGRETNWRFPGSIDIVLIAFSGEAKKKLEPGLAGSEEAMGFFDAIIPAVARQLVVESTRRNYNREYCDALAEALLQHLCHLLEHGQGNKIDSSTVHACYIQKAIDHIHQDLGASHSSEDLAKIVELNSSWFRQLFKQVTGMPVHRYIMQHRLERARDLLTNTNMSIAQIVSMTGFSNQSHLTDYYKKTYGVTPSRYRKML